MLCFRKILLAKKFMEEKWGGGVSKNSVENFCLKVPKNFGGESFSLSIISGIERIYASEGYVTIFHANFFVSHYRNIS